jgi:hypothetical protein
MDVQHFFAEYLLFKKTRFNSYKFNFKNFQQLRNLSFVEYLL